MVESGMVETQGQSPTERSSAERDMRYATALAEEFTIPGSGKAEIPEEWLPHIGRIKAVADEEQRHWKSVAEQRARVVGGQVAEIARLREELRKAQRAADLLAADHRAVERVQRRLDAWEQKLPENVRKDTVIEVLRGDLDAAA